MNTRIATEDDIDALATLFDRYRVYYKQNSDLPLAKMFLLERMQRQESTIFVAYDQQRLIGFVQLYPFFSSVNAKKSLVLNDLFVCQQDRGRGAGKALLSAAKTFADQQNACWIMLQTQRSNIGAQVLYESFGFQQDQDCFYYYL